VTFRISLQQSKERRRNTLALVSDDFSARDLIRPNEVTVLIVELEGARGKREPQCQNAGQGDRVPGADFCVESRRDVEIRTVQDAEHSFHSRLRATIMYWVSISGQSVFWIRMSARPRIAAITSGGFSGRSSGNFHMPIISMRPRVIR